VASRETTVRNCIAAATAVAVAGAGTISGRKWSNRGENAVDLAANVGGGGHLAGNLRRGPGVGNLVCQHVPDAFMNAAGEL